MKTDEIILYSSNEKSFSLSEFEEAFYNSTRQYSLRHLPLSEGFSPENLQEALQKSLQVCRLAGINSGQHFKKIYVYDAEIATLHIDWQMSKRGLNLMVMQTSSLNEKMARWLWELADL